MGFPASVFESPATTGVAGYPRLAHARGGGRRLGGRRVAENAVLGTAIFVATEIMVFAALISAFLILRAGSSTWPPIGQPRLPVLLTGLNTVVLLFSAYTMRRAVRAEVNDSGLEAVKWLRITAALGLAFVSVQGSEWLQLIHFGLAASSSIYGATFYTLIGCHGAHLLAAVIVVAVASWAHARSHDAAKRRSRLQAIQLYWSFVVGIWPLLYVLVYLS
jgi:heme/copper-type cytochrome/quinol oxidase subunit 3